LAREVSRESGETLRYFLMGAILLWLLPGLVYLVNGRYYGAGVNAIGAGLSFLVLTLWTREKLSYLIGVRLALGASLLALTLESFLVGQADSQSAWYMVAIALAAGYLCSGREIILWATLTGIIQLGLRLSESVVRPQPEYVIEGWELSLGQVILTVLCAVFAFVSRRMADERLSLVLQREQYIREQSQLLEEARDQAVAATKAKSRFLSTMSHEIRTPLYGILGAAQAIETDRLESADFENVTTVVQSGELLLAVLNDILDSAKLDAGEMSLHSRPFDLQDCLQAACRLIRPLTDRKGLELSLEISPELGSHWYGDEIRIRQIVLNLLTNACKFSSHGRIVLTAFGESGKLQLAVSDQGAGISQADQAVLFRPFQQLADDDARQHGGTGLGLWIVRNLARLMGGQVSLTSAPDQGSTFTVTLPISSTQPPQQPSVVPAPTACPLKVLVVDDNPVNRKVTLNLLKRLGHSAEAVEGGVQALEALAHQAYDAVLMDLQMPEMDGITATREIRSLPSIVQPSIVAFSADVQAGKRLEIGPHAFNAFLGKPLRLQQLGDCLNSLGATE
jgi:signal transduction histidine kinase